MWSLDERVMKIVEGKKGFEVEFVVREVDSIVSLNWFGEEFVDDVDWIILE